MLNYKSKAQTSREQQREQAKDKRIKMEGTQQSKMISQRKNDSNPINFELEGKQTMGIPNP